LMQDGALYPQQTLVQTIKENESGLWPTPNTLEGLAPKKLDRIMEYNNKSRPGRSYASMNLREQVVYGKIPIWPTPQARDHKGSSGRSNKGQELDLPTKVKLWPTPTASKGGSWRSDGQIAMIANTAATYQEYLMLTKGSCKSKLDKYWPTPTSSEHKYQLSGQSQASNCLEAQARRGELGSPTQVKMLPTPAARDYKGAVKSGKRVTKSGKIQNYGEQLPNVVGGQLNPTWVEWLMGWPLGWTDLKPLEMDKYQKWLEQHGGC